MMLHTPSANSSWLASIEKSCLSANFCATAIDSMKDRMVMRIEGTHSDQKSPSSNCVKKLTGPGRPGGSAPTTSQPVLSPCENEIDVEITTKISAEGMNFPYCEPGSFEPVKNFTHSRKMMQIMASPTLAPCEWLISLKKVMSFCTTFSPCTWIWNTNVSCEMPIRIAAAKQKPTMTGSASIFANTPALQKPSSRQITPDWNARAEPYAAIFTPTSGSDGSASWK